MGQRCSVCLAVDQGKRRDVFVCCSGNIIAWRKKEGDEVTAGDVFAEVETDKVGLSWQHTAIGLCELQPCLARDLVH